MIVFNRQNAFNITIDLVQLKRQLTGKTADQSPPSVPHALCLTVFLSKSSFSHTTYQRKVKKTTTKDVKIDVYFNGQFVESQLVTHKKFNSSGNEGIEGRIARFKGQRLSRMIEKPWVLFPPDQSADDFANVNDLRQQDQYPDPSASSRWTAIAVALQAEVDEFGYDETGKHTVTGDCLASLASLTMPSQLQDAGNLDSAPAKFGIIDVLVLCGIGSKDGPDSRYVAGPTRCRGERYHVNASDEPSESSGQQQNEATSVLEDESSFPTTLAPGPCLASHEESIEEGLTKDPQSDNPAVVIPRPSAYSQTTPVSRAPTSKPAVVAKTATEVLPPNLTHEGSNYEPPKYTTNIINELFPPNRSRTATPKGSRDPSMAPQYSNPPRKRSCPSTLSESSNSHPKRPRTASLPSQSSNPTKKRTSRFQYHHVVDTKQTLSEELQSIAEEAVDFAHERRTRTKMSKNVDSLPLGSVQERSDRISHSEIPTPSKIITLKISPEKLSSIKLGRTPSRRLLSETPGNRNTPGNSATSDASRPQAVPTLGKTPPASSNRSQTSQLTPVKSQKQVFDADFEIPALSKGCCITYAERGVVRNVPAVRGGWFKEEGVVMATRFIVG